MKTPAGVTVSGSFRGQGTLVVETLLASPIVSSNQYGPSEAVSKSSDDVTGILDSRAENPVKKIASTKPVFRLMVSDEPALDSQITDKTPKSGFYEENQPESIASTDSCPSGRKAQYQYYGALPCSRGRVRRMVDMWQSRSDSPKYTVKKHRIGKIQDREGFHKLPSPFGKYVIPPMESARSIPLSYERDENNNSMNSRPPDHTRLSGRVALRQIGVYTPSTPSTPSTVKACPLNVNLKTDSSLSKGGHSGVGKVKTSSGPSSEEAVVLPGDSTIFDSRGKGGDLRKWKTHPNLALSDSKLVDSGRDVCGLYDFPNSNQGSAHSSSSSAPALLDLFGLDSPEGTETLVELEDLNSDERMNAHERFGDSLQNPASYPTITRTPSHAPGSPTAKPVGEQLGESGKASSRVSESSTFSGESSYSPLSPSPLDVTSDWVYVDFRKTPQASALIDFDTEVPTKEDDFVYQFGDIPTTLELDQFDYERNLLSVASPRDSEKSSCASPEIKDNQKLRKLKAGDIRRKLAKAIRRIRERSMMNPCSPASSTPSSSDPPYLPTSKPVDRSVELPAPLEWRRDSLAGRFVDSYKGSTIIRGEVEFRKLHWNPDRQVDRLFEFSPLEENRKSYKKVVELLDSEAWLEDEKQFSRIQNLSSRLIHLDQRLRRDEAHIPFGTDARGLQKIIWDGSRRLPKDVMEFFREWNSSAAPPTAAPALKPGSRIGFWRSTIEPADIPGYGRPVIFLSQLDYLKAIVSVFYRGFDNLLAIAARVPDISNLHVLTRPEPFLKLLLSMAPDYRTVEASSFLDLMGVLGYWSDGLLKDETAASDLATLIGLHICKHPKSKFAPHLIERAMQNSRRSKNSEQGMSSDLGRVDTGMRAFSGRHILLRLMSARQWPDDGLLPELPLHFRKLRGTLLSILFFGFVKADPSQLGSANSISLGAGEALEPAIYDLDDLRLLNKFASNYSIMVDQICRKNYKAYYPGQVGSEHVAFYNQVKAQLNTLNQECE